MNISVLMISVILVYHRNFEIQCLQINDIIYSSYDESQTLQENFYGIIGALCPQSIYCAGESWLPNDTYIYSSASIRTAREDLKTMRADIQACCSPCSCRKDCLITNNCCVDARPSDTLSVAEDSQKCLQADIDQYRPPFSILQTSDFYYMVTKCPNISIERDKNITHKCEHPDSSFINELIPVQSTKTKLIYRNRYCAHCNGEIHYYTWDVYIYVAQKVFDYYGSDTILNLKKLYSIAISSTPKAIQLTFVPPDGLSDMVRERRCFHEISHKHTRCENTLASNSSVLSRFIKNACSYRKVSFRRGNMIFNNLLCTLCEDLRSPIWQDQIDCGSLSHKSPSQMIGILVGRTDVAEEQDDDRELFVQRSTYNNCTCRQLYDEITNTCRDVQCAMGEMYVSCKCLYTFKKIFGLKVTILLRIRSVDHREIWKPEETGRTQAVIRVAKNAIISAMNADASIVPNTLFRYMQTNMSVPVYDMLSDLTIRQGSDTRDVVKTLFYKLQEGIMIRANNVRFKITMAPGDLIPNYETIRFFPQPVRFDPQWFERFGESMTLLYVSPTLIRVKPDLIFGKYIFCKHIAINDKELNFITNRNFKVSLTGGNVVPISLSQHRETTYVCLDDYLAIYGSVASQLRSPNHSHLLLAIYMSYIHVVFTLD